MKKYRFCRRSGGWMELKAPNRFVVANYVENHKDELQVFAVPETGNVFGYTVELSDMGKPVAMLYPHEIANLIWVRCL